MTERSFPHPHTTLPEPDQSAHMRGAAQTPEPKHPVTIQIPADTVPTIRNALTTRLQHELRRFKHMTEERPGLGFNLQFVAQRAYITHLQAAIAALPKE